MPHADLRKIGAWVFVDHFGPTRQTDGMVVAAHPHTGLQTVTWLFEGRVDHRDSIGSVQSISPGQLNLMTAGSGISHSELSLRGPENLHAVQLWIALEENQRQQKPFFEHRDDLPKLELDGFSATVLVGEFAGSLAKTKVFSELVGVELRIPAGQKICIPLKAEFEYGLLIAQGSVTLGEEKVATNQLFYRPAGSENLEITSHEDTIAILLGGVPMREKIIMWWNFIERTHEEIVTARTQWNNRDERFGSFTDDIGGWIPAPELPNVTLQPR